MANKTNDTIKPTVDKFIFIFPNDVKYSLVANSIKSKLVLEPEIENILK